MDTATVFSLQYGLGIFILGIGAIMIYWCAQPNFLKSLKIFVLFMGILWPLRIIAFLLGALIIWRGFGILTKSEFLLAMPLSTPVFLICVFLLITWLIQAVKKFNLYKLEKSIDKEDSK